MVAQMAASGLLLPPGSAFSRVVMSGWPPLADGWMMKVAPLYDTSWLVGGALVVAAAAATAAAAVAAAADAVVVVWPPVGHRELVAQ